MRAAWTTYGDDAGDEFGDARTRLPGGWRPRPRRRPATVRAAASDMSGVLDVVLAVLEEHRTGMEECITDFERTDGNSAGEFNALTR